MGRKAVGTMCCVTHLKEPSALIEKRRGCPGVPSLIGCILHCKPLHVAFVKGKVDLIIQT